MRTPRAFSYAVVRVVPHVEREEFVNAGVVVFCPALDYLAARIEIDEARLRSLAPDVDLALVERHLGSIPRVCGGGGDAGPIGRMPIRERWSWLVAPRSTVLQLSPPHAGLTEAPDAELARIFDRMVRPGARASADRQKKAAPT